MILRPASSPNSLHACELRYIVLYYITYMVLYYITLYDITYIMIHFYYYTLYYK